MEAYERTWVPPDEREARLQQVLAHIGEEAVSPLIDKPKHLTPGLRKEIVDAFSMEIAIILLLLDLIDLIFWTEGENLEEAIEAGARFLAERPTLWKPVQQWAEGIPAEEERARLLRLLRRAVGEGSQP